MSQKQPIFQAVKPVTSAQALSRCGSGRQIRRALYYLTSKMRHIFRNQKSNTNLQEVSFLPVEIPFSDVALTITRSPPVEPFLVDVIQPKIDPIAHVEYIKGQFRQGNAAKTKRPSGIEVFSRNFTELIQEWERNGKPSWTAFPISFVPKECTTGLKGGARNKKQAKYKRGRKGRPRVQSRGRSGDKAQGGQLGLRNPLPMVKHPAICKDYFRYTTTIEADGSGNVSAYFNLRNPSAAVNGSGVYQRARNFSSVFDEFKVHALYVVVNNLVLSTSNGTMAFAVDYDEQPTGTYSYDQVAESQYARIYSGTNQIEYCARDSRLTSGLASGGAEAIIHQGGYYDFATPPLEGFIVMSGEGFVPGNKFKIVLTMNVQMRRARTLTIAKGPTIETIEEESSDEEIVIVKKKK